MYMNSNMHQFGRDKHFSWHVWCIDFCNSFLKTVLDDRKSTLLCQSAVGLVLNTVLLLITTPVPQSSVEDILTSNWKRALILKD